MKTEPDQEIAAISTVFAALKNLDSAAQARVIEYVVKKLNLSSDIPRESSDSDESDLAAPPTRADSHAETDDGPSKGGDDNLHGVSPVATKWMRRNELNARQLGAVFSLGVDEIDLVAKTVPGNAIRARLHNVLLLKGIASYLGTGAARFSHEQLKETCLHYNAYDGPNFARHLKQFASELSGTKESGYSLTPRGMTAATELVKQMVGAKKTD